MLRAAERDRGEPRQSQAVWCVLETYMETLFVWVCLFAGLQSSFAFPSSHDRRQHASHRIPQRAHSQSSRFGARAEAEAPAEEREAVHTVRVTCLPDSLEIVVKADMFAVGAPVDSGELRLGVEDDDYCRATASSEEEYRIAVGLVDCGTKHWVKVNLSDGIFTQS